MQGKYKVLVSAVITAFLTIGGLAPAQASVPVETIDNGQCNFADANQGRGSAQEPFLISSALDLRELNDCNNRTKSIYNGIANEDGTATFQVESVHGAYGVGQNIYIRYTDNAAFDEENATVLSSTADTVTVKTSAPAGTITAGGQIQAFYNHVKLAADIDLSAPSTANWFNNSEISITGATKNNDGTITYVGANTLQGGEYLFIDGLADKRFNQGWVYVNSATPTEFTTNTNFALADGEATEAGGKAHFSGWQPISIERTDFDGAGHTISGMKIYRHDSNQGFFASIRMSNVRNLKFANSLVDTTANVIDDSRDRFGILAGYVERSTIDNVTVESSSVVAGGPLAGLLFGHSWGTTVSNISLAGNVKTNGLSANANQVTWWNQFGGLAGLLENTSLTNATVAVSVDARTLTQNREADALGTPTQESNLSYVGGIAGRLSNEIHIENVKTTGNVQGGQLIGGAFGEMGVYGSFRNIQASGSVTSKYSDLQTGDLESAGGFAGRFSGEAVSSNLSAAGDVSVTMPEGRSANIRYVGGFAGFSNNYGANMGLKSTGTVTINQLGTGELGYVGGLIGRADRQAILDSNTGSNISLHSARNNVYNVGGVIGSSECCASFTNIKSTASLNVNIDDTSAASAWDIGGFVGYAGGSTSFSAVSVTGSVSVTNGHRIGGFAGSQGGETKYTDVSVKGNVTNSYSGSDQWDNGANTAGLIGRISGRASLDRVSVVGNVTATVIGDSVANSIGGLIGQVASTWTVLEILNSQYRGSVSGTNYVGGLIGYAPFEMHYRIEKTLIASNVSATATNPKIDAVMSSYFRDGTRTSFMDSTVAGKSSNGAGFIPATSAQLKLSATYTAKGWTFTGTSPWRISAGINDGYPYLLAPDDDKTVVNPPVDPPAAIKFTALKSITFSKKVTALTSAQKKTLTALAKTISNGNYKVITVESGPTTNELALAAQRATQVQAYLTAELKKLKATKTIGISVVAKTAGASAAIKVVGGK